jgi:hypothetical protein
MLSGGFSVSRVIDLERLCDEKGFKKPLNELLKLPLELFCASVVVVELSDDSLVSGVPFQTVSNPSSVCKGSTTACMIASLCFVTENKYTVRIIHISLVSGLMAAGNCIFQWPSRNVGSFCHMECCTCRCTSSGSSGMEPSAIHLGSSVTDQSSYRATQSLQTVCNMDSIGFMEDCAHCSNALCKS